MSIQKITIMYVAIVFAVTTQNANGAFPLSTGFQHMGNILHPALESIQNNSKEKISVEPEVIGTEGTVNTHTNFSKQISNILITHLSTLSTRHIIQTASPILCNPELLIKFYYGRAFKPFWISSKGLKEKSKTFIKILQRAEYEGLDSRMYHQAVISSLMSSIPFNTPIDLKLTEELVSLELLLTDAFFSFGFHVSEGIVSEGNLFESYIKQPDRNLAEILHNLLIEDKIDRLIQILQPTHAGYLRLKTALLKYQKLKDQGGFPKIPSGKRIEHGDFGERIAMLRSRLILSGDMNENKQSNPLYFDSELEDSVKRFQVRHGLPADGIVGIKTLAELNAPIEKRIEQIRLNMERWKWLPKNLGNRYIWINTAEYRLYLMSENRQLYSSRIIVGKLDRQTPVFSSQLKSIQINPYWNIPRTIALKDILPKIKTDPDYLLKNRIRVLKERRSRMHEINPHSINWLNIGAKNFRYRLRQDPQPSNALGRIKFLMPNNYDVYLHDTPKKYLFELQNRNFSSGCIRVEHPFKLAAYLIDSRQNISSNIVKRILSCKKTKTFLLSEAVNIHISYLTTWVEKDGVVHFRKDIYGRDTLLYAAIKKSSGSGEKLFGKK